MVLGATTYGDHLITGKLLPADIEIPNGNIDNDAISSSAGIEPSKLKSSVMDEVFIVGTVTTQTIPLGGVKGATRTVKNVRVWNITANTSPSTVTVDIKKNGATILASVITLNAATGNNGVEVAAISDPDGVVGDLYTAVVTAVQSGTYPLASGVLIQMHSDEDYA